MMKRLLILFFISVMLIFPRIVSALQISTSFSPASISGVVGADIVTDIKISPDSNITAQNFTINASFNTANLEIKTIAYLSPWSKSTNLGGQGTADKDQINSTGSMNLSGENLDPDGVVMAAGPVSVIRLTFTVKNIAQTTVNILSSSNINVVGQNKIVQIIPLSSSTLIVNQPGSPTPSPTPTPSPLVCSVFLPVGLTDSLQTGPGGIKIYNTSDYKGGRRLLNATRSPADAVVAQPIFTSNPTTAPVLTFEQAADSSGNWYVNIPDNNSIAADNDYTVSATVSAGSTTASCVSFIIHVPKKPVDTTCPTDINSTQVKFRSSSTENWSTTKTITLGDTIKVGGFHNNRNILADDILLTATGPEGSSSQTVDLEGNNIDFIPTLTGSYTITAMTAGKEGQKCTGEATLTVNAPQRVTTAYRIAENPSGLSSKPWLIYTAGPMLVDFEFSDKTPGPKTVFVEFKGSDTPNTIVRHQANIKLLEADPAIASCSLGFEGSNTIITLTAEKNKGFGAGKGVVKSGDTDLQVREWKNNSIKAVLPNAPEGQALPVSLTNADNQTAEGQCSSVSQLALGAKVFCRGPASHQNDNVDLILLGDYQGGVKIKQKVSIDKNGIIQGLTQKLEAGKNYKLSIKAPKLLRRTVSFTAEEGTTNISNFVLPAGDIFPADGGDGVINTMDKSELNRQWIISGDATSRSGDFNQDGRVNSIDWACMRYDFNSSNDSEPAPGLPASSPVPVITTSSSSGIGTTASSGIGATAR